MAVAGWLSACGGRAEDVIGGEGTDDDGGTTNSNGDGDSGGNTGIPIGGDGDGDGDVTTGRGGSPPDVVVNDCEPPGAVMGVQARYDRLAASSASRASTDFFAFPWPEISRSFFELDGFPNPAAATGCEPAVSGELTSLVVDAIDPAEYRDYLINLAGRYLQHGARHPGIYIAFDGALAPASLPSPEESLASDSPLFLVNVDASSAERGERVPLLSRVFESSLYLPENTLAAMPPPGFSLRSDTRYALVVLRSLGDESGRPLGSPAEFEARKLDDCNEPYVDYLEAFDYLERAHGVSRSEIAALTLLEAGRPTTSVEQLSAQVQEHPGLRPLLSITEAADSPTAAGNYLVRGTLQTPVHQSGAAPHLPALSGILEGETIQFEVSERGAILPDELASAPGDTDPSAPRTESVEFALSIPPPDTIADRSAIPLVVYGPGTGGSALSPMDNGVAEVLAQLGIAVFATTPVMHGARAGADNLDPELITQLQTFDALLESNYEQTLISIVESGDLFFTPLNLQAARGNPQQAALDYLWQIRVLRAASVDAGLSDFGGPIGFDAGNIYFFGHSQGAGIGPLLAHSVGLNGAVLSGASGHIPSTILYKTKPADAIGIPQMIDYLVCDAPSEPLDVLHPVMALIGHWFEPADAQLWAREFSETQDKPLFVVVGRDDAYAPFESNHAITTGARLFQLTAPFGTEPLDVPGQSLLSLSQPMQGYETTWDSLGPSSTWGNVQSFRQYHDASCADDHFVFVCSDQAVSDWSAFLQNAVSGTASVP